MASNSIKIYDDTVIKLSVNQGLEEQRSNEILGNFTNGELAYTRDTARLFVGDNSDGEPGHIGVQQTVGGSLVGNKYLGLIDSKPLVTFTDNGEPLSFEQPTSTTGTQELAQLTEQGLLTAQSKFRLHGQDDSGSEWHNWDRTAIFNPKYNAYNGDFMYDVYQNALILFDTHISGKPDSPTQPQIVKGDNGEPISPETFIVDGKQISSNDEAAVGLTRRTILQNYSKTNQDSTNSELVYGDGYVVMRMVEPDNQTIRFKRKSFQQNGLPTTENNYTHNLLEVFNVPLDAFKEHFTDDFVISDKIALNKDISNVKSITGVNQTLKIPKNLAFSTPVDAGRGATTYLEWSIQEPLDITVPTENTYKLIFTPEQTKKSDGSKQYLSFKAELEEEKPYSYTINLQDGLESDQDNPFALVIDARATADDITQCPTLKIAKVKRDPVLFNEDDDPYDTGTGLDLFYSGNLGIDETGIVMSIDKFSDSYYLNAQDKISQWEEQNTSVNFLKTPVTILQSSTAAKLYTESNPTFASTNYSLATATTPTNSTTAINDDIENLVKLAVAPNKFYVTPNKGTTTVTGVTQANGTITMQTSALTTNGFGAILTGPNITNKKYLKNATISGEIAGLISDTSTITLFFALVNNGKIIKHQECKTTYKDFTFGFNLSLDEVVVNGTNVFFALGVIAAGTSSAQGTISFKDVSYSSRSVVDEEIFTLSDAGVNVNVDFSIYPYVFCAKKTVSTPNNFVLPQITSISQYPTDLRSNYFTNFTATHNKTWNNLVSVLGHNHYKNLADRSSSIVIGRGGLGGGGASTKKAAFLSINSYEVQVDEQHNYSIKKHTEIGDGEESYMAFSWYKEYDKAEDGTEQNVIYYPQESFEIRTENIRDYYNRNINFVRVQDNDTNLINGGTGVVAGKEEKLVVGEDPEVFRQYRKQYAIYFDSELLNSGMQEGIEFGVEIDENKPDYHFSEPIINFYDFKKHNTYELTYDIWFDNAAEVVFVKNGGQNVALEDGILTSKFPDGIITADSTIPPTHNVNEFDYVILVFEEEIESEDGGDPTTVEFYETYKIIKSASYLTGFEEPKSLTQVQIVTGANNQLQTVTLDETLDEEDKVYIPSTARNIILELTHITTENNTIGVMYANRFDDLGTLLPGLPVEEFNNPATFSADIIINPSHNSTMTEHAYTQVNGKYKMKLGKTNSTTNGKQFHDITKTVDENKKRVPSIFAAAPKEKILCNSSVTETRVLEVPLQAIPGTDVRHFALRFANIRPSTSEILNQVVLRVIGYRV